MYRSTQGCTFFQIPRNHLKILVWYMCSRLQPATDILPQPSHTETPTHIETIKNAQCGDTIEKSQTPDDGCINVRNMLSIEEVK